MRILVADDDLVSRRLLESALANWGYEVVPCSDGDQAWRVLQSEDSPRLAILDWKMPGMEGPEICRRIRERTDSPYTYLIFLTARAEKQDVIDGLEVGADDYVTKPFDAQALRVRLRAGRRILDLQTSLLSLQETLRVQATRDPLTGAWNRTSIERIAGKALSRADRESMTIALVLADLDYFKQINDTHGHLAGDSALKQAAARIRESLRPYDEVGRYGGEEFLIVLQNADASTATSVCNRIRLAMREKPLDTSEGIISVTLSMGVAIGGFGESLDKDALLRGADEALYRAKQKGRDCVEFALVEAVPQRNGETAAELAISHRAVDASAISVIRTMDDGGLLEQLITLYFEDAPARLVAMREAIADRRAMELERTAHSLKGSSASLGVIRLSELCFELEEQARSRDFEAAASTLCTANAEFEQAKTELQKELTSNVSPAGRMRHSDAHRR